MLPPTLDFAALPSAGARAGTAGFAPHAVRVCEQACRALAAATMGAAQFTTMGARVERSVHVAMDCSFFAAACARALSRFESHDLETVVSLVDVCRRAADACAQACAGNDVPHMLRLCATTARSCSASCTTLLAVLHADVVVLQSEESPADAGPP